MARTFCGVNPGTAPVALQEVWRLIAFDHFVKGQYFLHFPLDASYERVFTHIYYVHMYMNRAT